MQAAPGVPSLRGCQKRLILAPELVLFLKLMLQFLRKDAKFVRNRRFLDTLHKLAKFPLRQVG